MSTALSTGVLPVGTTTFLTGRSYLNSIQVFGDGTNIPTVTVYDNITGSGAVLGKITLPIGTVYGDFTPCFAIRGDVGFTVVVAGTGATAIVSYGAA